MIRTDLPAQEAVRRRLDLLAELWQHLGERQIDIVLDDGASQAAVVQRARRESVPV